MTEEAFNKIVAEGGFDGLTAKGERRVVVLPWPSPKLSPNAREGHWAVRRRASTAARHEAFVITRLVFKAKPGWEAAKLDIEFCPPDRRRRDRDNLIASLKAATDGIADALGIDDSKFIPTYRIGAPVKGGAVRVTIEPVRVG